jgi:hypothetical protein
MSHDQGDKPMEVMFCRLKKYDPRRGHVLRRFTYSGMKFHEERGWYRVDKPTAEYLRKVKQVITDAHSPLAFDVCTEAEAKALDEKEREEGALRKSATDNIRLSVPREAAVPAVGALTSGDLPDKTGNKAKRV